ncbi:MAG TPA: amidase [Pseudolabrys sp.]|jgi:aspartyl-tRNA(Asn)/glutamyl-tRNA(Gln) amidotransferase subunit A
MSAIAELTCADLTAAYRGGALSPVEVARDCLTRIEASAAINAFVVVEPDGALAAAAQSQARWRAGTPLGPIDGVPASIKDNIWAKGLPTRRGSRTGDPAPAAEDSPATARLREQGAVVLGKTCMPEHGWIGVCHSPLTGITRNPWNPHYTPGGSTGGGAVAALLGLGVLHLGTDGAGSLRIPAAFTGVFGMKPSFGRVPVYPASPLNVLSHQGPITRTVADAALMLSVIAQPDTRDMAAWNTPAPDFSAGLEDGVRGLRIAFSARLGQGFALDPEIEAATRKAADMLEAQGAMVAEADPPLDRARAMIQAMWWPVMTALVEQVAPDRRPEIDPGILALAERGRRFTVGDYIAAYTARAELHNAMQRFHRRYDLLLTPTMPITALKVGLETPDDGDFGEDWSGWSPYTYPFNLTQQPAASVPSGVARNGLPMGAQIVGALGADQMVLRAARALEQALPMARPPGLA